MSLNTLNLLVACAAALLVGAVPIHGLDASTGSVSGKVVGADGAPQQDVIVKLLAPMSPGKPSDSNSPPGYTTKSDKDGKFTIDKVASGSFRVVAGDKARGLAIKEVTVQAGQTVTVELKLRKPPR